MPFSDTFFRYACYLLLLGMGFYYNITINNDKTTTYQNELSWDMAGYYAWLPATFFTHDYTFQNVPNRDQFYVQKGKYVVNRYSTGVALLASPFFGIGHIIALLQNQPLNGNSLPYRQMVAVSMWVYAVLGLWLLLLALAPHYDYRTIFFTLLLIGAGTNLYYYATLANLMSHSYSFFLFAAFFYLTPKWHHNPTYKHTALLGFVFGLILCVRATNAIIILLPILWGVNNWQDIKQKFQLVKTIYPQILLGALATLVGFAPQLAAIYVQTGHFFVNLYDGENFYWTDPKITSLLLDFSSGWLIYCPLVVTAFLGWSYSKKTFAEGWWAIAVFFFLNLYILSCWWFWWYIGFGLRALVESLVIASPVIAAFIQRILRYRNLHFPLLLIFVFFLQLQKFQSMQYRRSIIHFHAMTFAAYIKVWGVTPEMADDKYFQELEPLLRAPQFREEEWNKK